MRRPLRRVLTVVAVSVTALTVAWFARDVLGGRPTPVAGTIESPVSGPGDRAERASADPPSKSVSGSKPLHEDTRVVSDEQRQDALARAQVWRQPPVPIREAYLGPDANPPTDLTCKFTITELYRIPYCAVP